MYFTSGKDTCSLYFQISKMHLSGDRICVWVCFLFKISLNSFVRPYSHCSFNYDRKHNLMFPRTWMTFLELCGCQPVFFIYSALFETSFPLHVWGVVWKEVTCYYSVWWTLSGLSMSAFGVAEIEMACLFLSVHVSFSGDCLSFSLLLGSSFFSLSC